MPADLNANLNDIQIHIPACLDDVVSGSLKEVGKLHRRRVVKRVCTTAGSFLAVVGAFLIFGFTNPALASEIPFLGNFFKQVNDDSKVYGSTNFEEYGAVQMINQEAVSENQDCVLTVTQAYSDGYSVQLAMELAAPQEYAEKYEGIGNGYGESSTVLINGETPTLMQMNSFHYLEGKWVSTLNLDIPEALRERESYDVSLTLRDFAGDLPFEPGEDQPAPEPITGTFSVDFTVTADLKHSFTFACAAEENGAKVQKVSGTPARTAITVVKPYWGPQYEDLSLEEPDNYSKGYPRLYTESGEEIDLNANATNNGGYDVKSRESQTVELIFDGVPKGTEKVILKFIEGGGSDASLAAFTIDLTAGTVTAGEN